MSIALLIALQLVAPKPVQDSKVSYAECDLIVVNIIYSRSTTYDDYGRPSYSYSTSIWYAFYDMVEIWPGVRYPGISLGYARYMVVTPANGGFVANEVTTGSRKRNIFAPTVWYIVSDYDWEVRHRPNIIGKRKAADLPN